MGESAAGAVIQAGQTVMEKMKEKVGLEESEPLSNSIKKD